ncbi:TraB/GumN family protein [Seohaeicola zhoushanensis]|uniref:TraB/GumN family protein n=1 Tax=Seohaeicola zhoushanensis TaxID=1569283 RepID=A0A8J3GVJ4_9RHOB|nr:TraB/GumN family protein [Seohaeicola zhoushanensis]GHF39812.1 TraB/GumN family protein [Seohaeicola zhoushanensis]
MIRLLAALLISLLAVQAQARCQGVDLRDHLDASQSAALARELKQMPYAEGNHWIARKGARTIHIVGTMHVNDPRLNGVMRRLSPVIRAADAVLLEVTGPEGRKFWETPEKNIDLFVIRKGPGLSEVMSQTGWERLSRAALQIGLDPRRAERIQPWFLSIMLAESFCGPRGFRPQNGLDERIEQVAARAGVPMGSLETVATAIAALSRGSLADQARLLEYDLASATGNDHTYVTLREAYFEEKMGSGMVLEKWQFLANGPGGPRERQRLWKNYTADILDMRNRAWAPRIIGTPGDLLVVAVGAAHLPGREGVLNLLARTGYRLERAPF